MNINLTLFGQMFMFAIFVWFCMRFIWPPIVNAMEERKKRIEEGLLAAERGLASKADADTKAKIVLDQSKDKATQIVANANRQATVVIEGAKDIAIKEADKIKQAANQEIEQQAKRARNELKDEVADLVMRGVNAVLVKEVDSKKHQKMLGKLTQTL